nr:universal stress protein [Streptomyces lunaelactis]
MHAWELPCPADGWMPFAVPEADRATWEDEQVQMLSDVLRPWREKYPQIPVLKDVLRFTAAAALVRESMRMELLVVGRRSPALGPVVDVVRHGRCPFAVVPS